MVSGTPKASGAFRTIGEVSEDTGLPQHILRYWETRFPQLRPVTRAGNRRYYRPEDVALVRRIQSLLNRDGYTVRGVQQLLAEAPRPDRGHQGDDGIGVMSALTTIRERLSSALSQDERLA